MGFDRICTPKNEERKMIQLDKKTAAELAKCIVLTCFRNSKLENIHAGIVPQTEAGDYSDVFVTTPDGTIPWNKTSKISDPMMKELMIDVTNKLYNFLLKMGDEEFLEKTLRYSREFTTGWDELERGDGFSGISTNKKISLFKYKVAF